uniref:Small ribosomal subunit protein uS3c n=1 Tax=Eutreptiella sp. CCMP389 TaxID=96781 RepID=A0A977K885_9EUGL|nr:ribosomal protein S3 [Eutreptiella sp. CCMP389]
MGQKVHPFGFRVGITQEHQSDWFAKSGQYSIFLQEDKFIRDFIKSWFNTSGILKIKISRKVSFVYLDIFCAKPGEILNEKVFGLENLRSKLFDGILKRFGYEREILINVIEVTNPDSHSRLLAEYMGDQLEKRVPFRRVIRSAMRKAQQADVKGIKIQISGRLNGAEIARSEWVREGQVPLHTLRANINFCHHNAHTIYGILGIKVWILSNT